MYIIRPKVVIESILAYTVYNVLAQNRCLQSTRQIALSSMVSRLSGYPKKQRIYSSSKITASRCRCLMLSTQIIRQLRRKWKDASQVILHLILTGIKNMLVVVMAMKLCVASGLQFETED